MANNTLSDFPVLTNLDAASVTHVQKELVDYQVTLPVLAPYLAQTAISGADEKTDPVDADMVGLMDSAAAGNALKKFSWANFKAKLKTYFDALYPSANGWIDSNENWAYDSATTITVPSGAASKYSVGDKIKLTQSTVKYFYIVAVSDTLLTITGGTSYTLTNAAITDNYYSKASSPVGFPQWFSFTPSWTNLTVGSGVNVGYFAIIGRTVFLRTRFSMAADSAVSGAVTLTLPVAIVTYTSYAHIGDGAIRDNDTTIKYICLVANDGGIWVQNASATYSYVSPLSSTVPFTWAVGDTLTTRIFYQI